MPSRAHAEITGNVGGDPEIRQAGNRDICSFSIAVNNRGRRGEDESTTWYRAVIFSDGLIDVAEKYVHKGDPIQVAGRLQTSEWEDRDGKTRTTIEVIVSDLVLLTSRDGQGDRGDRRDSRDRGRDRDGGYSRDRGGDRDRDRGRRDDRGRDERRDSRGSDRRDTRSGGRDERRDEPRGGGRDGDGGGRSNTQDLDDQIPF